VVFIEVFGKAFHAYIITNFGVNTLVWYQARRMRDSAVRRDRLTKTWSPAWTIEPTARFHP
jgi:predicted GIY-YIG superfamily endonuclease